MAQSSVTGICLLLTWNTPEPTWGSLLQQEWDSICVPLQSSAM